MFRTTLMLGTMASLAYEVPALSLGFGFMAGAVALIVAADSVCGSLLGWDAKPEKDVDIVPPAIPVRGIAHLTRAVAA